MLDCKSLAVIAAISVSWILQCGSVPLKAGNEASNLGSVNAAFGFDYLHLVQACCG